MSLFPTALTTELKWDILLLMRLTLAHIGARSSSKNGLDASSADVSGRCSSLPNAGGSLSERRGSAGMAGQAGGSHAGISVLLDSRGRQMSSEAFAAWLGGRRDQGAQHIVFAVGPAGGWSDEARAQSGPAALIRAHDAGSLAGAAGNGGTALPRGYNSDGPPVPRRTLRDRCQLKVVSCQLSVFLTVVLESGEDDGQQDGSSILSRSCGLAEGNAADSGNLPAH